MLFVGFWYKGNKAESYKDYSMTELMAVGSFVEIGKLPIRSNKFTAEELIMTGYIPEQPNDNNFIVTDITTIKSADFTSKNENTNKIFDEQNNFIRSHFGL